jgi:hypothetical protein
MTARTEQLASIRTAAEWLEARQADVLQQGFRLQQVTVHVLADDAQPDGDYAEVRFQWRDGAYDFTVS